MTVQVNKQTIIGAFLCLLTLFCFLSRQTNADGIANAYSGNFGLPGIIDLPTARRYSDGNLVISHQNHKNIFMNGISFQALPRLGLSFRYGGHGSGGGFAQGRINWDRSFDAHFSITDEGKILPALSFGLRDFIGTGWYSSEYVVGTKSFGNMEFSAGIGYGRLAGRNSFSNPLKYLSSDFETRLNRGKSSDLGGTLGNINWFQGNASIFYGVNYKVGGRTTFSAEYTPDIMLKERRYMKPESAWNLGASFQINDYVSLATQYLYGNQFSVTANVAINPEQPPSPGGKELAPVPMRLRGENATPVTQNSEDLIRKVLAVDRFEVHHLKFSGDTVSIIVTNTKFRSTAQAIGRLSSTLQRFSSDQIKFADISLFVSDLNTANYRVDLEKITKEQFSHRFPNKNQISITAIDKPTNTLINKQNNFTWGVGPYLAHRLFNPDLPLSMEAGFEVEGGYMLSPGLKISGSLRKSVLTNPLIIKGGQIQFYLEFIQIGHFMILKDKMVIYTHFLSPIEKI